MQDIDDLVKYARREIDALPPTIRSKVIGSVQAPLKYDRSALQSVRPELEAVQDEAQQVETDKLERSLRNSLLYMAAYELILLVFADLRAGRRSARAAELAVLADSGRADRRWRSAGWSFCRCAGGCSKTPTPSACCKLQARYIEALNTAADKQIAYGMQLRREAIAPLTRLIEAQTEIHTDQLKRLQAAGQEITKIEADLAAMGKPSVLGVQTAGVIMRTARQM